MSAWVTIDCLLALRSEVNYISPNRDKGADGTIGDSSHDSGSDHTPDEDSDKLRGKDADSNNEVHALDIDSSGPWPGSGTQKQRFHAIVMNIIAGEKKKWLSKDDKCRLRYVIWDRKIYHIDNDFEPEPYTLDDPHTNHAHFSGRYETSCERDTRPFITLFVEDFMGFIDNQTEFETALAKAFAEGKPAEALVGAAPLNYNGGGLPGGLPEGSNFLAYFADSYKRQLRIEAMLEKLVPTETKK